MNVEPNAGRFTFKDAKGRPWDTTLTLGAANRVDAADLSAVYKGEACLAEPSEEFLVALTMRPSVIAAVVWLIVLPQAEKLGVDEQSFVDAIDRPALDRLKEALWGSLCDFFPDLASGLSQMIQAQKRARQNVGQAMMREAATIEQAVDQMVNRGVASAFDQLKKELGTAFTDSEPPQA